MTDCELLELAAKAAGVDWFDEPAAKQGRGLHLKSGRFWNPLTDDGDALRLAVKCNLDIELQEDCVFANGFEVQNHQLFEWHKDDPYAATRRAIVRAAAEIGRNKLPDAMLRAREASND